MKYVLTLIVFLPSFAQAQTENTATEQKRPSWSQGLPERKKAMKPTAPAMDLSATERATIDPPEIEKIRSENPSFEIEQLDTSKFEHQIKVESPVVEENVITQPVVRIDQLSKRINRSNTKKPDNPLHQKYNWKVLHTTPIRMPTDLRHNNIIDVLIYINPDGSVFKVTSTDPAVSSVMLKYVSESIENWQFDAPKKLGINDVLAKKFAIEIKS